jgi:predicted component of type VI protein secretion system
MKLILKQSGLILLLIVLVTVGCTSETKNPNYNPNEFTLMVAASNDGEVGPCG